MAKALSQLDKQQTDERLRYLLRSMLRQFGGVEGLVAAWRDCHEDAKQTGGFALLHCVHGVLRLQQTCEELDRQQISEMSDEELERAVALNARQLILQEPQIAVRAARDLGWRVIPPDTTTTSG